MTKHNHSKLTRPYKMQELIFKENAIKMQEKKGDKDHRMMGSKENAGCWLGGWLGENN